MGKDRKEGGKLVKEGEGGEGKEIEGEFIKSWGWFGEVGKNGV